MTGLIEQATNGALDIQDAIARFVALLDDCEKRRAFVPLKEAVSQVGRSATTLGVWCREGKISCEKRPLRGKKNGTWEWWIDLEEAIERRKILDS